MLVFLKKHLPVLLIAVTLVLLAVFSSDTVYVSIELEAYEKNFLQVFWSEKDRNYSEKYSDRITTTAGKRIYTIPVANSLFVERVRIDLQEGQDNSIPGPILLHSISYHARWFFKSKVFNSDLAGVDVIKGIETFDQNNMMHKITFTDSDPILDFELKLRPVYYQFFLPIFFLLTIHALLSAHFIKGRKNRFLIFLDFPENCGDNAQKTLSELHTKPFLRRIALISQSERKICLQVEVEKKSISDLFVVLSSLRASKSISRFNCAANRSGEVSH